MKRITLLVLITVIGFSLAPVVAVDEQPALAFSTYLGGEGNEFGEDIAVDNDGNIYVVGSTSVTDDLSTNPVVLIGNEIFITKFDPTGTNQLYSFEFGTGTAFAIEVDADGAAYVVGLAETITTVNAIQPNSGGIQDAFIAKINPAGTGLVYSTYLGGSGNDLALDVAIDPLKNAYIIGSTNSTDFPTHNPFQATRAGIYPEAFVAKLNASGMALIYSTYLGGSETDNGNGIAVDDAGNAYITGFTQSNNFPVVEAFQSERAVCPPLVIPCGDAYVAKLSPSGVPIYSTHLGGDGDDRGTGIAIDASGNAYVVGYSSYTTNFPTVNAYQPTQVYPFTAFVTKFDSDGLQLLYSTYLGTPTGGVMGTDIAVDAFGRAYVAGVTEATDFPLVTPIQDEFSGKNDAFITTFSTDGLSLTFSTYLGGSEDDAMVLYSPRIFVNEQGIHITGSTHSNDFPLKNAFQSDPGGATPVFAPRNFDAFFAKIASPIPSLPDEAAERNYFTTHTPTLTWKPVTWATGYRVEVNKSEAFDLPNDFEGEVLTNTDSITTDDLVNGFYYWRIQTQRPDGSWTAWKVMDSFTVLVDE